MNLKLIINIFFNVAVISALVSFYMFSPLEKKKSTPLLAVLIAWTVGLTALTLHLTDLISDFTTAVTLYKAGFTVGWIVLYNALIYIFYVKVSIFEKQAIQIFSQYNIMAFLSGILFFIHSDMLYTTVYLCGVTKFISYIIFMLNSTRGKASYHVLFLSSIALDIETILGVQFEATSNFIYTTIQSITYIGVIIGAGMVIRLWKSFVRDKDF